MDKLLFIFILGYFIANFHTFIAVTVGKQHTQFCRLLDIVIFLLLNGRRSPSWFFEGIFGPHMKSTWWSLSLCKIWLRLMQ